MGGRDSYRVWDGHVRTAMFKMENQQEPTVQHKNSCLRSCGSLDGRGIWGRMDTCTRMPESFSYPSETITTLLVGYAPM